MGGKPPNAFLEEMGGKVSVHSIEGEGTTLDIKV